MDNKIVHAAPVPPFVTFVASAVPMVFDNSMSYYEALCALWKWLQDDVINVINNNASVTEEYIQLTKDMKEYMDNYFENLDVQEEINNKLDQMAEDGTLGELLARFVTPEIERLDEKIDDTKSVLEDEIDTSIASERNSRESADSVLQSQISGLASGSPLVAPSVSGMEDTSRVYVNTSDGKWYYWNGSAWTEGGTYQSTGIGVGEVIPEDFAYNTIVDDAQNIFDYKTIITGGFINGGTGVITPGSSASGLNCYTPLIPVEVGATYYLKPITHNIAIYDGNGDFIRGVNPTTSNNITIASGEAYIRCSLISSQDISTFSITKGSSIATPYHYQFKNLYQDTAYLALANNVAAYLRVDWTNSKVYVENANLVYVIDNKVQYNLNPSSLSTLEILDFSNNQFTNYIYLNKTTSQLVSVAASLILSNDSNYVLMGYVNKHDHKFFISGYGDINNQEKTGFLCYFDNGPKFDIDWDNSKAYIRNATFVGYTYGTHQDILHTAPAGDYEIVDFSSTVYSQYIYYNKTTKSFDTVVPGNLATLNDGNHILAGYVCKATQTFFMYGVNYNKTQSLTSNYVIDDSLLKETINYDYVGTISKAQAFCKYDNYYYSTDGSEVVKQDSSFNVVNTVSLNTGHGNSFQLGNNGYAYISGWNDNKIYVIDLSDISIDSVINLPTTGYTTGVVDDINGFVYILQRDTDPSNTDEYYNFIKYDYVHSNVVFTKKTTFAFRALQSMDFFEDKIAIAYGLGTTSNGYKILDTNGNVLTSFTIPTLTGEPEGICMTRDTKDLLIGYMSSSSQLVYKFYH